MNAKHSKNWFLFTLLVTLTIFSIRVSAQVTIGSSEQPAPGAVLDLSQVSSKDLGLLLPQVELTDLSLWSPLLGEAIDGMFVYNINEDTGTGIYYWKDDSWIALATAVSVADSWSLKGNAEIDEDTDFIGTTDDKPLIFKVNNKVAGFLEHANSNVSFGWDALSEPQGNDNTALGMKALFGRTYGQTNAGHRNTAVGVYALEGCAFGAENTAIGAYSIMNNSGTGNTAIGTYALQYNQGSLNIAVGIGALDHSFSDTHEDEDGNLDGLGLNASHNIAVGAYALRYNLNDGNIAIGHEAAMMNRVGNDLTAVGFNALRNNRTGGENTAHGYYALKDNVTGNLNTAVGAQSLVSNIGGSYNTAVGAESLFLNQQGESNVAVGAEAMNKNTTGSANTGVGAGALHKNTIAIWNTGIGTSASWFNEEGSANTAVGGEALSGNRNGSFNTAVGTRALFSVDLVQAEDVEEFFENAHPIGEGASENTAVGYESLKKVTSGGGNTAMGSHSMSQNSSGEHNVAIGRTALNINTTGGGNTAIGSGAMKSNITGEYNTAIGAGANIGSGNGSEEDDINDLTNSTAIGAGAGAWKSNQVHLGSVDVTSIGGVVNWTRTSDMMILEQYKENIKPVPGLSFINQLNPITYNYNPGAFWIGEKFRSIVFSGFKWSEVVVAAGSLNYDFSGIDEEDGLRYADFVAPLVQAVKELSAENTSLQSKIDELTGGLNTEKASLQDQIDAITGRLNTEKASLQSQIDDLTTELSAEKASLQSQIDELRGVLIAAGLITEGDDGGGVEDEENE